MDIMLLSWKRIAASCHNFVFFVGQMYCVREIISVSLIKIGDFLFPPTFVSSEIPVTKSNCFFSYSLWSLQLSTWNWYTIFSTYYIGEHPAKCHSFSIPEAYRQILYVIASYLQSSHHIRSNDACPI